MYPVTHEQSHLHIKLRLVYEYPVSMNSSHLCTFIRTKCGAHTSHDHGPCSDEHSSTPHSLDYPTGLKPLNLVHIYALARSAFRWDFEAALAGTEGSLDIGIRWFGPRALACGRVVVVLLARRLV